MLQHNITGEQKVGIWPDETIDHVHLVDDDQDDSIDQLSNQSNEAVISKVKSTKGSFAIKVTIVFILLVVGISGALFRYYKIELDYNEKVLELQSDAKLSAIAGNYQEAIAYLDEAISIRPHFNALQQDQNLVYVAVKIERIATELEEIIDRGDESEAEKKLEELRQELNGYKEPIFDKQREKLEELNMKYTILSLTNELTTLGSISELGNLLNVVNGLIGEEAETLRDQIIDRIRTTATAEVNDLLTKKKFTAALNTTESALAWARTDETLLELKQKVKQEQAAYELAEEQRIQQAMEEAAAEDYINQTAAIDLIEYEKVMNELGNIVVVAYLKNVATRSIYDVTIGYKIVDSAGTVINDGTTGVTPSYIASGEGMSFSVTLPEGIDYEEEINVTISDGSWSLE
ncbi:MAG: FxLYD domain-containing protein [Candidatus Pristimantibacillus lignocellulolyticus]|uniref:FxLYD domain-containing protein n=1 Tax=Candidatus Pristimantibacillus lignocellulolyticus TaxID=2994561 RepID=A0A9J6ZGM6_9BACL|nr:MAG: FxLYD domain-containing protein [Candidatus Pristimantibacillus lignocellulolyticus]